MDLLLHLEFIHDLLEHGKLAGEMAVEILKDGKKPADMPVGFSPEDALELVVSEKNAEAFGVKLPEDVLKRADEKLD